MQILVWNDKKSPPAGIELEYPYVSLYQDNWDDFGWKCKFTASIHIADDEELELGPVRIASENEAFRVKKLPALIPKLPMRSASLGESVAYYRRLRGIRAPLRRQYLNLMRDIVSRPTRRERITDEHLWSHSFMREASSRHAFRRGGYYIGGKFEESEPPNFSFNMRLPNAANAHRIRFNFSSYNGLPNRTILLVGRNGTGKTTALASLAASAMPRQAFDPDSLSLIPEGEVSPSDIEFSRLIAVSYNAFDEFPLPKKTVLRAPRVEGIYYKSRGSYKYCGLRGQDGAITKSEISQMLNEALVPVIRSERLDVLRDVLSTLLDPGRADALTDSDSDRRNAAVRALSAGQRLVVSIFSNIIGFIEEKSLLLIDEPETNLHPGLLSTLVSALNETLTEFDSYAIVATHSPILLQQVPSRYVLHIKRDNTDRSRVQELEFESFGEDIGELTRKVLGLADQELDFTNVLTALFHKHGSAKRVAELFDWPLGIPAMAHLYGLENDADET